MRSNLEPALFELEGLLVDVRGRLAPVVAVIADRVAFKSAVVAVETP